MSGSTDIFSMEATAAAPDYPEWPMRLLAAGVPLSLLLDLAAPNGPDSAGISRTERPSRIRIFPVTCAEERALRPRP